MQQEEVSLQLVQVRERDSEEQILKGVEKFHLLVVDHHECPYPTKNQSRKKYQFTRDTSSPLLIAESSLRSLDSDGTGDIVIFGAI